LVRGRRGGRRQVIYGQVITFSLGCRWAVVVVDIGSGRGWRSRRRANGPGRSTGSVVSKRANRAGWPAPCRAFFCYTWGNGAHSSYVTGISELAHGHFVGCVRRTGPHSLRVFFFLRGSSGPLSGTRLYLSSRYRFLWLRKTESVALWGSTRGRWQKPVGAPEGFR